MLVLKKTINLHATLYAVALKTRASSDIPPIMSVGSVADWLWSQMTGTIRGSESVCQIHLRLGLMHESEATQWHRERMCREHCSLLIGISLVFCFMVKVCAIKFHSLCFWLLCVLSLIQKLRCSFTEIICYHYCVVLWQNFFQKERIGYNYQTSLEFLLSLVLGRTVSPL